MNDVNFVGGEVLSETHLTTAAGEVMSDVQLLDELHVLAQVGTGFGMRGEACDDTRTYGIVDGVCQRGG